MLPILAALAPKLVDIVAGFIPDSKAKAEVEAKLLQVMLEASASSDAGQSAINREEAGNSSLFVSGWRPAVGWIAAVCFGYAFLLRPWLIFFVGMHYPDAPWEIPDVPMEYLWELLLGMMGLSGLRTWEKFRGVAR